MQVQSYKHGCPNEWELTRFIENRLSGPRAETIAMHLVECEACRARARGLLSWLENMRSGILADEANASAHKVWLRMQWRHVAECFKLRTEFLAAADGQTGDDCQTKNALGSGFIHFLSRTPRGQKGGWHVKMAIPACPTAKTILRMSVLDGVDEPIMSGTLHFCRMSLPVVNGRATMALVDFQHNLGEALISLDREGYAEIPGDPVLGYELMR